MTATQLVNPEIDRVDAVNGPATGLPFLMFKSLDAPAEVAPAEEVAKSEEAPAEAPVEAPAEVAKSEDAPAEDAPVEEVAKSESEDADKASKTAKTLAVLRNAVQELAASEGMEEEYSSDAFDLMDAGAAIDYALGILAKFALTEAVDAASENVEKALHLEVHEKPEEEAPAPAAAAEAPAHEAPVHEAPAEPTAKAETPLPSGLQEILDTFVESYTRYKEAQDSGAQTALAEDNAEQAALEEPAPAEPKEPAAAPAAEPAAAPVAAPEHHEAPTTHPEAPQAAHEAPAAAEEDPSKKVAKSMDELIAEAVRKAVDEATTPLLKQIDTLERTPVDSGPLLAGQTPDNGGTPALGRGQAEGAVAKGLRSATVQAAPGAYALAEALKGIHQGA